MCGVDGSYGIFGARMGFVIMASKGRCRIRRGLYGIPRGNRMAYASIMNAITLESKTNITDRLAKLAFRILMFSVSSHPLHPVVAARCYDGDKVVPW